MRTLYLECNMGAAGDMLTAALLELVPKTEKERILDRLNQLGLPGVKVQTEKVNRCGILGTHMVVTVEGEEEHSVDVAETASMHTHQHAKVSEAFSATEGSISEESYHDRRTNGLSEAGHHHHHTSLKDVEEIIDKMELPAEVKTDIRAVYHLIGEAEGQAHGMPIDQIHFHEVGTMDAILDVTAVCLLVHVLHPDMILASPIRVGFGEVQCAHGIMPVPAPATAYLLRGIPTWSGDIRGEMCTPTGAALLRYYVKDFTPQPLMKIEGIGYGMGTKEFPAANCVRAFLGETVSTADFAPAAPLTFTSTAGSDGLSSRISAPSSDTVTLSSDTAALPSGMAAEPDSTSPAPENTQDQILELRCNLDDMTGEEIGFAMQAILDAGARDVFTTPIGMKKNRPGILLTVICAPEEKEKLVPVIFRNTTTLGIRETICSRNVLNRSVQTRHTPYGDIPVKTATGYGVVREKAEYDALARIAGESGNSLLEIKRNLS